MTEPIIYVRGLPISGFDPDSIEKMIKDAKVLLQLESEQLAAIREQLSEYPGFLDKKNLSELFDIQLGNREQSRALARLISVVSDRLEGQWEKVGQKLTSLFERWMNDEENKEQSLLSAAEFEELETRLRSVLEPFPGLVRQSKAKHLSLITGQPLEQIELICDIRPIFDDSREIIEGMIPFTTIKVTCKGVDGLPVGIEAILSEEEVQNLVEASQKAKKKLEKIRRHLEKNRIPIPNVEVTERGEG